MKILIFDTETTGLLPKDVSLYQSDLWPYIVQFSFIMYNTISNKIEMEHDYIIKIPKEISIPKESTKIHGITKQKSNKQGYNMKDILEIFNIALESCDFVVAHNLSFDKKILMVEGIRHNTKIEFTRNGLTPYCTMRNSINLCNIEKVNNNNEVYKKFPTLAELHVKLFGVGPSNLHNSFVDILICMRCFYAMIFNEDLCKKNKRFNSLIKEHI